MSGLFLCTVPKSLYFVEFSTCWTEWETQAESLKLSTELMPCHPNQLPALGNTASHYVVSIQTEIETPFCKWMFA